MTCVIPLEFWLVGEMRQRAADNKGIAGLGMDKVETAKQVEAVEQSIDFGAYGIGQRG